MAGGLAGRDAIVGNVLDRVDAVERRLRLLEDTHPGAAGEAADRLAYYRADGSLHLPGVLYSEENAVWGYYDRWAENLELTTTATSGYVQSSAVPAGEVWVLEFADIRNVTRAGSVFYIQVSTPTNNNLLVYQTAVAQYVPAVLRGPISLAAGDRMTLNYESVAIGDALEIGVWGYRMLV